MYELLYASKTNTKFAISVFQISENEVIFKNASNTLTVIISLSTWNEIISNPNFNRIQFKKNPLTGATRYAIIFNDKSQIDIIKYVVYSMFKSKFLKTIPIRSINIRNSNSHLKYNKYENYIDLTIQPDSLLVISRSISKPGHYFCTAGLPRNFPLSDHSIPELLENWCKHIHEFIRLGDIHISELSYNNEKYIIDHQTNSITIENIK